MSASAKKKLRKEQNAAQLTEKQLKEQKEAKKLKVYTGIFIVAIAIVLVAGIAFTGVNFYNNSGIVEKNTTAVVIGDHEMNSVELSYYYQDMISSNYNSWQSSYGDNLSLFMSFMGLDLSKPLNEQQYNETTTWADYFVDAAVEKAKSDHLLYEKATKEGFTLPEEDRQSLDNSIEQLPMFAAIYGYSDTDTYLRSIYGPGAKEDSYRAYSEKAALANAYYTAYGKGLQIDEAAIRAYEEGKYDHFSSFSFASYHISYTDYLTGGTQGEDGTMVYTEAEETAARNAAKADAKLLSSATSVDELNKAIAALPINKGTDDQCSTYTDSLYETISTIYRDWLASAARKAGDCTMLSNKTTVTDEAGNEKSVENDFYAVLFLGRNENERPLANVRHILVNFEGGTTDDSGNRTYSDAEKAAAKAEAEAILAEFQAGAANEESFAALATEKTDDTGSAATGGLYEDITPQQGIYVESFTNWAVDPDRKAGDTGIIESTYGYHVMYYVGDDALTYRDYMIQEKIRAESVQSWYNDILAAGTATKKNISRLNLDMVLQSAQ